MPTLPHPPRRCQHVPLHLSNPPNSSTSIPRSPLHPQCHPSTPPQRCRLRTTATHTPASRASSTLSSKGSGDFCEIADLIDCEIFTVSLSRLQQCSKCSKPVQQCSQPVSQPPIPRPAGRPAHTKVILAWRCLRGLGSSKSRSSTTPPFRGEREGACLQGKSTALSLYTTPLQTSVRKRMALQAGTQATL